MKSINKHFLISLIATTGWFSIPTYTAYDVIVEDDIYERHVEAAKEMQLEKGKTYSDAEIRKRYRGLAKSIHPDAKNGGSNERFAKINVLYKELLKGNPQKEGRATEEWEKEEDRELKERSEQLKEEGRKLKERSEQLKEEDRKL